MKSLRLTRSLAIAAVIALAGCAAAPSLSPSVGTAAYSRLVPPGAAFARGGKMTAAYSGSFSRDGDCSATAMFSYTGTGNATFLHTSSEQIRLTWYCGSRDIAGSATLTSTEAPRDSITANVSSSNFKTPCYGFTMSFTVTGGTGRFRRASGSGTIVVHRRSTQCLPYSYRDKWRGTLKF